MQFQTVKRYGRNCVELVVNNKYIEIGSFSDKEKLISEFSKAAKVDPLEVQQRLENWMPFR